MSGDHYKIKCVRCGGVIRKSKTQLCLICRTKEFIKRIFGGGGNNNSASQHA